MAARVVRDLSDREGGGGHEDEDRAPDYLGSGCLDIVIMGIRGLARQGSNDGVVLEDLLPTPFSVNFLARGDPGIY
jgi:hypothetical protein